MGSSERKEGTGNQGAAGRERERQAGLRERHRKSKSEEKGGTYRVYTRSLALLPEFHPLHLYFGERTLPTYIFCFVLCF